MSFTKNDRIFRSESGKTFPVEDGVDDHTGFSAAIAAALSREFGQSSAAVKTVARLVGANERAVRNWFEGKNGPSGEHIVCLMQHSDAVTEAILRLAHRDHLLGATVLAEARMKLQEMLAIIERPET